MENHTPEVAGHRDVHRDIGGDLQGELRGDVHAAFGSDAPLSDEEPETSPVEMRRIDALRIPVGTNLADAERWMIFATLEKCGGNKTRAAALLGVSLKTLYNRLNAYRAQGLAMDYDASAHRRDEGRDDSAAVGRNRGFDGRLTETQ